MTTSESNLVGRRVRCINMKDDPRPIPSGTEGTIYYVGGGVVNVNWDDGRTLGLVKGVDTFVFID